MAGNIVVHTTFIGPVLVNPDGWPQETYLVSDVLEAGILAPEHFERDGDDVYINLENARAYYRIVGHAVERGGYTVSRAVLIESRAFVPWRP